MAWQEKRSQKQLDPIHFQYGLPFGPKQIGVTNFFKLSFIEIYVDWAQKYLDRY